MPTPRPGDPAPAFAGETDRGEHVSLDGLRGKKVVLYFYPKDDTPGCTREACGFRDRAEDFAKKNAVIIGVSTDTNKSHARFREKYNLPFSLLPDEEKRIVNAYGVWVEKSNYGKKYMGTERTTFVIDEDGKIAKVYPKVKVDGHIDKVLAEL
ncbi:MAG: thioredoxin-dependent thiol peroxidase [SAR202 cluster bacterium]|nr:thioredoxin-dependent thiol peroxidase [SAR202 cluster bacterium]